MVQRIEGDFYNSEENKKHLQALCDGENLAKDTYIELECRNWVSKSNTLTFDFGKNKGILEADELSIFDQPKSGRYLVNKFIGVHIKDKQINDNNTVTYVFTRKKVQELYYNTEVKKFKPLDIIEGRIGSLNESSAFVDIGYGVIAVIKVSNASVVHMSDLRSFFTIGERVKMIVKHGVDAENPFLIVSHKELLGTWEDNVSQFDVWNATVGKVVRIEDYGIFVMLTPNLVGLAECVDVPIKINDVVSVSIRNIASDTSKIKLLINTTVPIRHDNSVIKKNYIIPPAIEDGVWYYNKNSNSEVRRIVTDFNV